jgi:hypothetical protein
MDATSVPKAERMRKARALALTEAEERFRHELMDQDERQELADRIRRLRRQAEKTARRA